MLRMDWIRSPERLAPLILQWNTQAGIHYGEAPQPAREEKVLEEIPAVLQAFLQLFAKLLVLTVRASCNYRAYLGFCCLLDLK